MDKKFWVSMGLGVLAGFVFNFSSAGDKLCQRSPLGVVYMMLIDFVLSGMAWFIVYFVAATLNKRNQK